MEKTENRAGLKRLMLPVLLTLWAAFAASWVIISTRMHVHPLPVPRAKSLSMNFVALIFYVPPIVMLMTALGVAPNEGILHRALVILGWVLAAFLAVAVALAAPFIIGHLTPPR
jgi:hypothetical protein